MTLSQVFGLIIFIALMTHQIVLTIILVKMYRKETRKDWIE